MVVRRFTLRAVAVAVICALYLSSATAADEAENLAQTVSNVLSSSNLGDAESDGTRRLRALVDRLDQNGTDLTNNHDHSDGWPKPGPESFAITSKMLKDAANRGDRADFPLVIQPISFINFVMKDGTGRVPYDAILQQVAQLNAAFSGQEARAARYASATDSNIRFKLAGVRYVVNDDYFNLCALPSTINVVRPRYMMSGAIHLNVYVCWCQNNLGLAWLPYDSWFGRPAVEDSFARGAIVHWQLLPGNTFNNGLWNKGNILTHEVGHTFGLRHPYEGDCLGTEDNSDQIDDTPRMTGNPLVQCRAVTGRDSCPSLPGKDDMTNYMVATADSCRNHFTPGQVQYMQNVIQTFKPTLLKQLLPTCIAAIDSTDGSPDLQPCLTGSLTTDPEGKQWCKTDPDNDSVWAWACCPTSMDWTDQECWKGSPDFSVPTPIVAAPRRANTPGGTLTKAPTTKAPVTNGPTKTPTPKPTKKPTKSPTRKQADASSDTETPSAAPSPEPTPRPTKKPTRRRRAKARRG